MPNDDEPAIVFEGDLSMAGHLKSLLEGRGIPAFLLNEFTSTLGDMAPGGVRLAVAQRDLLQARAVVNELLEAKHADSGATSTPRRPGFALGPVALCLAVALIIGMAVLWPRRAIQWPARLRQVDELARAGKDREAIEIAWEALRAVEASDRASNQATDACLDWLTALYDRQSDYQASEPLYARLVALRRRRFDSDHPLLADALFGLAAVHYYTGKYDQALKEYQEVVAIRSRTFKAVHPDLISAREALQNILMELGRFPEAEEQALAVLSAQETRFPSGGPAVERGVYGLALLAELQGRYETAMAFYERELRMKQGRLGSEHPGTTALLVDYAHVLRLAGKDEQAASVEQKIQALWAQQRSEYGAAGAE